LLAAVLTQQMSWLVHAAPPVLSVTVRSGDGLLEAQGQDLEQTDNTPMTRLTRRGSHVIRENIWPTAAGIGQLVLLPGGEVGTPLTWWNAPNLSEWRWSVDFDNHR
jgi:hypothetical protein